MYNRHSYSMRIAGFDWDKGNRAKCEKHGVTVEEIEDLFAGDPLIGPDPFDPGVEIRLRAMGRSRAGRHIFVVFTMRTIAGAPHLRPISARYMHAKEVQHYER